MSNKSEDTVSDGLFSFSQTMCLIYILPEKCVRKPSYYILTKKLNETKYFRRKNLKWLEC